MSGQLHRSVLLEESLEALAIRPDGRYVDGTFGRGGHARALLSRLGPAGRLLVLDRDPEAIAAARVLAEQDPRVQVAHQPFSRLGETAARQNLAGGVLHGILLDLGVSSPQLDQPERGFSFTADGPLDMRMDPSGGEPVAQWLAYARETEIAEVLRAYGEERFAGRIARAIVHTRQQTPLRSTRTLAALVAAAVPRRQPGRHPATRTFQALRIQVNRELEELRAGLAQVGELLTAGGRLVVISFHSLEDRIVKRFLRDETRGAPLPRGLPVTVSQLEPGHLRAIGKAKRPSASEVAANPRARSAVMRVAERVS